MMNQKIDDILKQRVSPSVPKDLAYNIIQETAHRQKPIPMAHWMTAILKMFKPVPVLAMAVLIAVVLNVTFFPAKDISLSGEEIDMVFASLDINENFEVQWLSDQPLSDDEVDAVFDSLFVDEEELI